MLKSKRTVIIKAGVNMYEGEGDSWYNSKYTESPDDKNKLTKEYGSGGVSGTGQNRKTWKRSPYD